MHIITACFVVVGRINEPRSRHIRRLRIIPLDDLPVTNMLDLVRHANALGIRPSLVLAPSESHALPARRETSTRRNRGVIHSKPDQPSSPLRYPAREIIHVLDQRDTQNLCTGHTN